MSEGSPKKRYLCTKEPREGLTLKIFKILREGRLIGFNGQFFDKVPKFKQKIFFVIKTFIFQYFC
jgi:hypothetical protein